MSASTKALLRSDAIFNFASSYFYKHSSIASPESFVFQDSEYDDFIDFIKEGETNFKTNSEKKFESAFELSEKENLSQGIAASYRSLSKALEDQKIQELNTNKARIKEMLSDEIINRYYFKKGEYQNHIEFSPYIKKSVSVLENQDRYRSILMNEKN